MRAAGVPERSAVTPDRFRLPVSTRIQLKSALPPLDSAMTAALPYDQLLESSMRLPPQDRSRLAARLIESLDDADDDIPISDAWRAELDRRVAAVSNGTLRTVPHQEVMSEVRALLADIQVKKQAA